MFTFFSQAEACITPTVRKRTVGDGTTWFRSAKEDTGHEGGDGPTDILTADEVAVLLRLDRKTVYTAAKSGLLPCLRIGRLLRFSRTAVLQCVAQGRVVATEED